MNSNVINDDLSTLTISPITSPRSLFSLLSRLALSLLCFISLPSIAADHMSHHNHSNMPISTNPGQVSSAITIADPVKIYQPLPGKNMSAGYPVITNGEKRSRQLLSVSAPWAERIEIHTHQHKLGMMRMVKLDNLAIEAGESAQFKPGGLHLMIFGVQQPLPKQLSMTFCFDKNQCIDQVVEVTDY